MLKCQVKSCEHEATAAIDCDYDKTVHKVCSNCFMSGEYGCNFDPISSDEDEDMYPLTQKDPTPPPPPPPSSPVPYSSVPENMDREILFSMINKFLKTTETIVTSFAGFLMYEKEWKILRYGSSNDTQTVRALFHEIYYSKSAYDDIVIEKMNDFFEWYEGSEGLIVRKELKERMLKDEEE